MDSECARNFVCDSNSAGPRSAERPRGLEGLGGMMRNSAEIAAEVVVVSKRLHVLQAELHAAKEAEAIKRYGVAVGDIVMYRGKRHRVTVLEPSISSLWLRGNPERKDGTFGTADRHLYNGWTKIAED